MTTPDDAARLQRLLDGAPARDADDRATLALLAAIRDAEPPAPPALRRHITTLAAHRPAEPAWRRPLAALTRAAATARRRPLRVGAPVAAAILAAALILPALLRDGDPATPPAAVPMSAASADHGATPPPAPAPAASEAAPARTARAPVGVRIPVADGAALTAAAARARAIIAAHDGRILRERAAAPAGRRQRVLLAQVPPARAAAAVAGLRGLGPNAAAPEPPAGAAGDAVRLRVVIAVRAGAP